MSATTKQNRDHFCGICGAGPGDSCPKTECDYDKIDKKEHLSNINRITDNANRLYLTKDLYEVKQDRDNKWYPDGPGVPFNPTTGQFYPETRFDSKEDAEKLCRLLNCAVRAGTNKAFRIMHLLLDEMF